MPRGAERKLMSCATLPTSFCLAALALSATWGQQFKQPSQGAEEEDNQKRKSVLIRSLRLLELTRQWPHCSDSMNDAINTQSNT
jgi:hypothetical protein